MQQARQEATLSELKQVVMQCRLDTQKKVQEYHKEVLSAEREVTLGVSNPNPNPHPNPHPNPNTNPHPNYPNPNPNFRREKISEVKRGFAEFD